MKRVDDESAPALFAAGQQLLQAGRRDQAQHVFRRSIARDRTFLPAHFALGQLMSIEGNYAAARQSLSLALRLSAQDKRDLFIVAPALASVLSLFQPKTYDALLDEELRGCLAVATVDAQSLARVTAQSLLLKYPNPQTDLEAVGRDPLWAAFLTDCLNNWPPMEARLVATRQSLLNDYADGPKLPHAVARVASLIALQAFAGEYAWPMTAAETVRLALPVAPLLAALYCSLAAIHPDPDVKALKRDKLTALLVKRTYADLQREAVLAESLTIVGGEAVDEVSAKVREQYEENPYPRWRAPPTPRATDIRQAIEAMPGVDTAALPVAPWQALIAGCGTGYEVIGVARTNPGMNIVAADLSGASLAYCARMMDELGVGNVTLTRTNILNVATLGQQFGLIYSTGVLHHMASPDDGLTALCSVLQPGGVMRISLYSERARQPIRAAHALIQEHSWTVSASNIRSFRAHILALPADDPLAALRNSDDFYSLSGCRDLAFHVQEHRYTLPGVSALLRQADLSVIAFDAPPDILGTFHRMFGMQANTLDLSLWDILEAQQPSLFVGMYQLWCQKGSRINSGR